MKKFILLCGLCLLVISCKKSGNEPMVPNPKSVTIVYLEANNNLKSEAWKAINDLEEGLKAHNLPDDIILAYIKDNANFGYLLKITPDSRAHNIVSDTIKTFVAGERTDGKQIHDVLSYIRDEYKSDQYNLILWSHGTAWSPAAEYNSEPRTRSFGEDRGKQIDVLDLKNALPMHFNFIIFDACAMASVEVLYEFKDKANYIIASPTDVLSDGFPYRNIVPYFSSSSKESVINIADTYFKYYNSKNNMYRSASISVTDLSKLDNLAQHLHSISKNLSFSFNTNGVQRLDFVNGFPIPLYDLGDFTNKNYSTEEYQNISDLMNQAIIYKNHTSEFLGNKISRFSGLSISIPKKTDNNYDYYLSLTWSKIVGMHVQ